MHIAGANPHIATIEEREEFVVWVQSSLKDAEIAVHGRHR